MRNVSDSCGFDDWLNTYLKFPPEGHAPRAPPSTKILANGTAVVTDEACFDFWYTLALKAANFNPCISNYNIIDHCPYPWDYVKNSHPYWNRLDVKMAINAPVNVTWEICAAKAYDTPDGMDTSLSPDHRQLPHVIETTQNVIIAHGALDYALPLNGVLMGIQNMTWGGKQGFQTAPCAPFYVPHFTDSIGMGYAANLPGGSGIVGTTHTERGLTLAVTALAGHMGSADSAAGAFRHVEKLLGRADSLSEIGTFTLPQLMNITQDHPPLGRGVVQIPCFGTKCYTDGQCQS
jgi:carboxypeptidase D